MSPGPSRHQQVHVGLAQAAPAQLEVWECVRAAGVRDRLQEQVEQGQN